MAARAWRLAPLMPCFQHKYFSGMPASASRGKPATGATVNRYFAINLGE